MKKLLSANDVALELGISRSSAYKVIHNLNEELKKQGDLVVSGKVPKKYLLTRYFLDTEIAS